MSTLQEQIAAKTAEIESLKPKTKENHTESTETTAITVESSSQEDPFLKEAIEMGFDPNHKGPNKKSAEQFVKDGSFFKKIDAQNKKIDDLLNVVKGLDEHSKKLQEAAQESQRIGYEKAMRELQIKKAEAVEEGNLNKFNQVEAEIHDVNKTRPQIPLTSTPKVEEPSEDMKKWAADNSSWFDINKNPRMVKEASGLFDLEVADNPNRTHKEILDVVKEQIARLHPDKFENLEKKKPVAVSRPSFSSSSNESSSELVNRLSEKQLQFYKQAKASKVVKMTIDDYAKQLDLRGDLKNE